MSCNSISRYQITRNIPDAMPAQLLRNMQYAVAITVLEYE